MYYKKYGELPQISNSNQLAATNLLNTNTSNGNIITTTKASNKTTSNTPNKNRTKTKSDDIIANEKIKMKKESSSTSTTATTLTATLTTTNSNTSEQGNDDDDEEEDYDNDDDKHAEADDEDEDLAVSTIDDTNDMDDQEDKCDQEVDEINTKTLIKASITNSSTESPKPVASVIVKEEKPSESITHSPLNLKVEQDIKQPQIKASGFLSINNLISATNCPQQQTTTTQIKNESLLPNSPSSKVKLQSNTPDTTLSMISNASTPTPTPPPPSTLLNRPPSVAASTVGSFQPHMFAQAFQQLLQAQQNPNFNLNNSNHELLMQQHLQQQQQHFLNKLSSSGEMPPTGLMSNSHSACSSPVPNLEDLQPQPPPIPINILVNKQPDLIKPDSNAMFMRVWDRGTNCCSLTDLQFRYLPNAKYIKVKEQLNKQKEAPLRLAASSSPSLNQQMTKNHSKQESLKSNSPFNNNNNNLNHNTSNNSSFKESKHEKSNHKEINENGSKSSFIPPPKDNGNDLRKFCLSITLVRLVHPFIRFPKLKREWLM